MKPAGEREAFEGKFPIPAHCTRCGDSYAATEYNAWDAHAYASLRKGWMAALDWLSSQPKPAGNVPEGYRLVPYRITDAMNKAGVIEASQFHHCRADAVDDIFKAMADAAPYHDCERVDYKPPVSACLDGDFQPDTHLIIAALVSYIEQETCLHLNTHRGGAIWEICDDCDMKWADDRGGKPEFKWPECVEQARSYLEWLERQ